MRKIELLAPAGSYESLLAAYGAGADAVYAGGAMFGARAYAENFTEEQLLQAIDYAHLHGKKLYLVVNTLLKSKELQYELYDYIAPLYARGLDGVIVQDVGVLTFLKEAFPNLPLHASTQMTVTGIDSALFLKEQGIQRLVPARELSTKELQNIKKACGLELEVFIHGALCYCYSGQCFFSSLLGGRSGNRGRCAQPCRLPYTVNGITSHILSPKDLLGLSHIPALHKAGVDSFKIEGRMKSAAYTAGVVSVYRKYLDLFYENPNEYKVLDKDVEMLMDIYNRGGMTDGYFNRHNDGSMISQERPNHFGLLVGSGKKIGHQTLSIQLQKDLSKGDVLELRDENQKVIQTIACPQEYKKGQSFPIYSSSNTRKNDRIKNRKPLSNEKGAVLFLYRTKNKRLTEQLESLAKVKLQREIEGSVFLAAGKKACLILSDTELTISVEGAFVQEAQKQPLTSEAIESQLSKTGGTSFMLKNIQCHIDGNVFLPKQELNALRREGLETFEKELLRLYERELVYRNGQEVFQKLDFKNDQIQFDNLEELHENFTSTRIPYELVASVETREQLDQLLNNEYISRIDIDFSVCPLNHNTKEEQLREIYEQVSRSNKLVYHKMPGIFRERSRKEYEQWFSALSDIADGFVVRNMDSYAYVMNKCKELGLQKDIICDFTIYAYQKTAADFWKQNNCVLTAPIELNSRELLENAGCYNELVVYGRYPMMISAGCVDRTSHYLQEGEEGCKHNCGMVYLGDRYGKSFPVKQYCNDCYNIIYNSLPLSLLENKKEIDSLDIPKLRLMFTTENKSQVISVINAFIDVFLNNREGNLPSDTFTRGHFKRGVE